MFAPTTPANSPAHAAAMTAQHGADSNPMGDVPRLMFGSPTRSSGGKGDEGNGGTGTAGGDGELDGELREETAPQSKRPRRYKVIFHNDDYTTQEYVVYALQQFFHKNLTEAMHIMLSVHRKGSGIAGVYPRDVAETKVDQVTSDAREHGMPLLVTTEPEEA
jgi:ATP-dependent Clp protease adaptor protein ClpS